MSGLPPDVRDGARDVAPTLLAVFPFGLVVGAAAVDVGLSVVEALGMSVVVLAGASQLAAIALIGAGAPAVVVVFTALYFVITTAPGWPRVCPPSGGSAGRDHCSAAPASVHSSCARLLAAQRWAGGGAGGRRDPRRGRVQS
jgi:hypothetical protein